MQEKKLVILESILGKFYRSGISEYLFQCPKCEHHKRKLSINIEKNVFKCWVCDWSGKNIYRIVRTYGSSANRNNWRKFFGHVEIENFSDKLFGKKSDSTEASISLPKEFISLANKDLPATSVYALNYLFSRGITKKEIIRWKIGYCSEGEYAGRVIIPSFDLRGKVNYFVARSFAQDWKKYLNPPKSKNIVFNHLYVNFDEELILVEGVFDAIVAGPNSVPLLGSTLRENHILLHEIVKNDTPVYIALDPDANKKEMHIINMLMQHDIEVCKIDIPNGVDVADMGRESFTKRKHLAKAVNSNSYLTRAIQNL